MEDIEGLTEREWIFNLNISATENASLTKDVVVSFVPQQLISLRLENYSNLVASVGPNNASTEAEFVSSQTESSLIVPGESGLIKIFADYNYSYFEDISITSSTCSPQLPRLPSPSCTTSATISSTPLTIL